MSYMRGEFYVWSDGDNMHINGELMPIDVFNQLVAMQWARMTEDERKHARLAAVAAHGGNFGCDALCKELGLPTVLERIERESRDADL